MDSGYYAAFTGLLARSQALDSAASNLANSNTNGFRAEREYFRNAVAGPDAANSQVNRTVNDYGVLGGNSLDLAQGPLVHTGNPLDLAIQGNGFFAIQTTQGTRYTRDGSFQRSGIGTLITAQGEPVLSTGGKPVPVPNGAISIGSDGAVSVNGAVVARIGVFSVPQNAVLIPQGVNRYQVQGAAATLASNASLHQGSIESSNEDAIQGSLHLMLVQRQAEMMQKALSIFHSDFDKTATEDLPKV